MDVMPRIWVSLSWERMRQTQSMIFVFDVIASITAPTIDEPFEKEPLSIVIVISAFTCGKFELRQPTFIRTEHREWNQNNRTRDDER